MRERQNRQTCSLAVLMQLQLKMVKLLKAKRNKTLHHQKRGSQSYKSFQMPLTKLWNSIKWDYQ